MATTDPVEQAVTAFKATGKTWRERAVQPPAYTPTADQIRDLWRQLLEDLVEKNSSVSAGRYLRVRRMTSIAAPRELARFSLEVEAAGGVWQTCAIVDYKGALAELEPKVDNDLAQLSKRELVDKVRELRGDIAEIPVEKVVD